MKNKVLIELIVPGLDNSYDIYIPINKKVGSIINLLQKAIFELSDGIYVPTSNTFIYNSDNGEKYDINIIIKDTDIRNGSKIVLM